MKLHALRYQMAIAPRGSHQVVVGLGGVQCRAGGGGPCSLTSSLGQMGGCTGCKDAV